MSDKERYKLDMEQLYSHWKLKEPAIRCFCSLRRPAVANCNYGLIHVLAQRYDTGEIAFYRGVSLFVCAPWARSNG